MTKLVVDGYMRNLILAKFELMRIHFVQHEIFEATGAYLTWAEARGHEVSFSKVYAYQPLPDSADGIDMLIVMGGPQSPDTTTSECPHFDAKAEMALIQTFVRAGKTVVGVCLGAQLIGDALGGAFAHSPEKEVGTGPIQLTSEGLQDEKVKHFGSPLTVGHWHSDMPGLTPDSKILAVSEGCPRQIVAYSNLVYGFQCHMELTREVVEGLIASEKELLQESTRHRFVQTPQEIRNYDYTLMNQKLFQFLDKL